MWVITLAHTFRVLRQRRGDHPERVGLGHCHTLNSYFGGGAFKVADYLLYSWLLLQSQGTTFRWLILISKVVEYDLGVERGECGAVRRGCRRRYCSSQTKFDIRSTPIILLRT